MNRFIRWENTCIVAATAALCLTTGSAFACDNSAAAVSTADRDLWQMHGCDQSWFRESARLLGTKSEDWSDFGYKDACNLTREWAKTWNATWLVNTGLKKKPEVDATVDMADVPFHDGEQDVLDSWRTTAQEGEPTPRTGQIAVWTGSQVIVWGGVAYVESGGHDPPLLAHGSLFTPP